MTSRERDVGRAYATGSQKRKSKAKKLEREQSLLSKVPKLTEYFQTSKTNIQSDSATENKEIHSDSASDDDEIHSDSASDNEEIHSDSASDREETENSVDTMQIAEAITKIGDGSSTYSSDPAEWNLITDDMRQHFASNQPSQNLGDFSFSKRIYGERTRQVSLKLFHKKMPNGETRQRKWLIYSRSTGSVFCYVCKLFTSKSTAFSSTGFSNWSKGESRVRRHENNQFHRQSVSALLNLQSSKGRVDMQLSAEIANEKLYWRDVLKRVVSVVSFLAERCLSFRGDNEIFGSPHNGNFLGLLEFLSQYDSFLADHIAKFGNRGRGNPSYLSKTIYEEFLQLMGKKVLKIITDEVKAAKYFSISVDSTPDLSHVDQLTFIIRYVDKDGVAAERFLKFIPIFEHDAASLTQVVVSTLTELGLNVENCRGQSYDNASNMAGKYSGLQARIKDLCPLADYVPCGAHSLNLVLACAAESCVEAVSFFGLVQTLYNFFSASTYRWNLLNLTFRKNSLSLKSLSQTRWSARADASKALRISYREICTVLRQINEDMGQHINARAEANSLLKKLMQIETALMVVTWDTVLQRANSTSRTLQKVGIGLSNVVLLYKSLHAFISSLESRFDEFEMEALQVLDADTAIYKSDTARARKKKRFFDDEEEMPCESATGKDAFVKNVFLRVIECLLVELKRRSEVYLGLQEKFAFLTEFRSMSDDLIRDGTLNVRQYYPKDIDNTFTDEFLQFCKLEGFGDDMSAQSLGKLIKMNGWEDTFPNTEIAFRIYNSMFATNCEGERSFSVLSRVKRCDRSTMTDKRLNVLSLLSIEYDITKKLNFDDIIDTFADEKSGKKSM